MLHTAAVILGLIFISSDAYASEEYAPLIQKAYKDRNDKYGQWNPDAIRGARLRDKREWAVANAVIGNKQLSSLKTIFQNYITSDLSSASPDEIKALVLRYLASPQYAIAHQFVKAKDYQGLATLLQITGPEILLIPDTNGECAVPPSDLIDFPRMMAPYLPDNGEIARKLKAILPTLLMENIEALINQINAFKKQHAAELKNEGFWGDKWQELGEKQRKFNNYCEELSQTPLGRKLLRDYRFSDKSSLISYYVKKLQKESDWNERSFLTNSLQLAMTAYFEDNVPITAEVIDISDLDSLIIFLGNASSEGAKNTLYQYRNKKGHNLAQLVLILEEEEPLKASKLHQLRDLIQDNAVFLSLLRQTAPGLETAEEMLINTPRGIQILKELDPTFWVRPGKFGVTPLMKEALNIHEDLEALLYDLRQHGVLVDSAQADLFGNTVESIIHLATSNAFFGPEKLLVKSLKSRPLQESLWVEYFDFPYYRFISIWNVLDIVHKQPQTPLHRAFWQVEVNHDQATANNLWRSLFRTHDEREDLNLAERREQLSKAQQRTKLLPADDWEHQHLASQMQELEAESARVLAERIPLAERALGFLSVEHDQDGVTNMLARGGTFGINFTRKISRLGGRIIMQKCRELGQHFADKMQSAIVESANQFSSPAYAVKSLNDDFGLALTESTLESSIPQVTKKLREKFKKPTAEIQELFHDYVFEKVNASRIVHKMLKDSLFQEWGSPLDNERERKLLNHRLNCAVVTLSAWIRPRDGTPITSSDENKMFDDIDETLQSFLPAGHTANSKARFERLYGLYGESME